ncbi:MAG: phosphohydrolase, partial [Oscillospiraceae bacterium]|nr:phosphohydrolase [Oscillospiraceae bacterium]
MIMIIPLVAFAAETTSAKLVVSTSKKLQTGLKEKETVNFVIGYETSAGKGAQATYSASIIQGPGEISVIESPELESKNQYGFEFSSEQSGGICIKIDCDITYKNGGTSKLSKNVWFEVSSSEKPLLSFGAMSDTHVNGVTANARFEKALDNHLRYMPNYDLLALVGDITDSGAVSEYIKVSNILDSKKIDRSKIFVSIGNHEFYESARPTVTAPIANDQDYTSRFVQQFGLSGGKVYYKKEVKGYQFITIGSEFSRVTNKEYEDNLVMSEEQYTWLEQTLSQAAQADPSKPIFLMCHQPLSNTVYGSGYINYERDERLKGILKKYPQIVLYSGHSHRTVEHVNSIYEGDFTMVNTASTFMVYYGSDLISDASQSIFTDVYTDRIVIKGFDHIRNEWVQIRTISLPYEQSQKNTQAPVFSDNGNLNVVENAGILGTITFDYPQSKNELNRFEVFLNGKWYKTENVKFWEEEKKEKAKVLITHFVPGKQNEIKVAAYDIYS